MEWITIKDAAELLGIAHQTVQGDPLAEKLDNGKRGTHRKLSTAYVKEKVRRLREKQVDETISEANRRKAIAEANKAEREELLASGEIVYCSVIETGLCTAFANFRNNLLSIPNQTSPMLVGVKDVNAIKKTLTTELNEVLNQLHGELDNLG